MFPEYTYTICVTFFGLYESWNVMTSRFEVTRDEVLTALIFWDEKCSVVGHTSIMEEKSARNF